MNYEFVAFGQENWMWLKNGCSGDHERYYVGPRTCLSLFIATLWMQCGCSGTFTTINDASGADFISSFRRTAINSSLHENRIEFMIKPGVLQVTWEKRGRTFFLLIYCKLGFNLVVVSKLLSLCFNFICVLPSTKKNWFIYPLLISWYEL